MIQARNIRWLLQNITGCMIPIINLLVRPGAWFIGILYLFSKIFMVLTFWENILHWFEWELLILALTNITARYSWPSTQWVGTNSTEYECRFALGLVSVNQFVTALDSRYPLYQSPLGCGSYCQFLNMFMLRGCFHLSNYTSKYYQILYYTCGTHL